MNIPVLVVSIALWGIVHSILASPSARDSFQRAVGAEVMRGYRLFYNFFAVVSFAPILWLMRVLPDEGLYRAAGVWFFLMLAGQGLSALCLLIALLQTDTLSFVGLRQIIEGEKSSSLVTSGFYRLVRHPLYLFSLLFLWLTPVMSRNMLVVYLSLTIYLFVGAYFEERKLAREFGAAYQEYRSRTPMIIPGLMLRRE